jgi:hypothetical protein
MPAFKKAKTRSPSHRREYVLNIEGDYTQLDKTILEKLLELELLV